MDETFIAWVGRETPQLLRTAYALTGNRHDAWDLLQETVLRVASRWPAVKDEKPGAYASTVMARLNIDRFRRARREILFSIMPDVVKNKNLPAEIDRDQIDADLLMAMRRLTPKQRTALVLRYVHDLDTETIARRMNCSPATVRTHLSRGLGVLRRNYPNSQLPSTTGAISHE